MRGLRCLPMQLTILCTSLGQDEVQLAPGRYCDTAIVDWEQNVVSCVWEEFSGDPSRTIESHAMLDAARERQTRKLRSRLEMSEWWVPQCVLSVSSCYAPRCVACTCSSRLEAVSWAI